MLRLQERPAEAIALVRGNLSMPVEAAKVERLIADLDSDAFTTRLEATDALVRLGESARPFLQRVVDKPSTLEGKYRVEKLLEKLGTPFSAPPALRLLRAVEVLERIGTEPAATLLRRIAEAAEDPLAPEARRSLERFNTK
jgi:hypothetical protein